jgi:predicted DNA-binding transcriptional regulator AlpA
VNERRLPASDLVGTHEIAERLGYSHSESIHNLRKRHEDFPKPFAELGAIMIWSWTDVKEWAIRKGKLEPDEE